MFTASAAGLIKEPKTATFESGNFATASVVPALKSESPFRISCVALLQLDKGTTLISGSRSLVRSTAMIGDAVEAAAN